MVDWHMLAISYKKAFLLLLENQAFFLMQWDVTCKLESAETCSLFLVCCFVGRRGSARGDGQAWDKVVELGLVCSV